MATTRARQDGRGLAIGDQRSAESQGSVAGSRDTSGRGSVFTIGHSNHSAKKFVGLLKEHRIEVLVDTRSRPYSRHAPRFNAKDIEAILSGNGIEYLFLGLELGGRLSVGLTRPWRKQGDTAERHWLQVNNIHLRDDPLWR